MASKVVVIDNDRQVRDVVCAALEDDGLVAVGMGSYPEAIQQLCWSPADLAISDGFVGWGDGGLSPAPDVPQAAPRRIVGRGGARDEDSLCHPRPLDSSEAL